MRVIERVILTIFSMFAACPQVYGRYITRGTVVSTVYTLAATALVAFVEFDVIFEVKFDEFVAFGRLNAFT